MKRSGYVLQCCATSSLLIIGPLGPCHAQSIPTETLARSISASVSSIGGAVSDHLPGLQRRNDSNIGFSIQPTFGCCIQASMIIFGARVGRGIEPNNDCLALRVRRT